LPGVAEQRAQSGVIARLVGDRELLAIERRRKPWRNSQLVPTRTTVMALLLMGGRCSSFFLRAGTCGSPLARRWLEVPRRRTHRPKAGLGLS
jgi:hypothetical protein